MIERQDLSKRIQAHNALDQFEYDLAVDWAIELIEKGNTTQNVLMLASFSKPVDAFEIRPYVDAVLSELGLKVKKGDDAVNCIIEYHLAEIIYGIEIRSNLTELYKLFFRKRYFDHDDKYGLKPFYFLYHGWDQLDSTGVNQYFTDANLDNIENVVKEQANIWMENSGKKKE